MTPRAYLSLVLHAHLPYVRHPELPEFLEEQWLFEALSECYLPLLQVFERLFRDGIDFRLAMSVTPTLGAMLDDELLRGRYRAYLDRRIELAESEVRRQHHQPELREVAVFYRDRFLALREFYHQDLGGDVAGRLRRLELAGRIELAASAATHAVLPLLKASPSLARAQVKLGVESHRRRFGSDPAGFWLPECAFYPGLDEILAEEGIRWFVLETHAIERGSTRARHGVHAPVACPSGVAAFGRDPASSRQVWSAEEGYPGHPDYREFYQDLGFDLPLEYLGRLRFSTQPRSATGMKYHRITARGPGPKAPYRRAAAMERAREHARDFLAARERQAQELLSDMEPKPIIVAPYDAELFGHWWFEGPEWIEALLREIDRGQTLLATATPSEYLAENREAQLSVPSLSSWGKGGGLETWINDATRGAVERIERAGAAMESLAGRHRDAEGVRRRAVAQAARELLLAQASDWTFMITAGTTSGYAERRIREHLERFAELAAMADRKEIPPEAERRLRELEERTPIFPKLDPDVFAGAGGGGQGGNLWARWREPRRVAFLSAEAAPYVKVGGLADVIGALPRALAGLGLETVVIIPAYRSVDRARFAIAPIREDLTVSMGGRTERFRLLEARPPAPGVRLLLVDHPAYFDRAGTYTDPLTGAEYPDSGERFIFFTLAALEALRALGEPVDVVHCHDHQTALAPALLRERFGRDPILGGAASVLTIHNLGYQGVTDRWTFEQAGLAGDPLAPGSPFEAHGRINPLAAGIRLADRLSVVSEGYAREIREDPQLGAGLQELLRERGGHLAGILNGIDTEEWNPAADPLVPFAFDAASLDGKQACQRALRQEIGLDGAAPAALATALAAAPARDGARPLAAMITRLVDQKGLDLVAAGLEELLAMGLDLVVLGTGLPKYEELLTRAAAGSRGRIAAILKFDNGLAHRIEAAADMFLMPSLYEPCGLNQMYSLRYGTVPVVRATGGLADTIRDADLDPARGNGFTFKPYRKEEFLDAVARARRAFDDRGRWRELVLRGMAADNSWTRSAARYRDLYREALAGRSAASG